MIDRTSPRGAGNCATSHDGAAVENEPTRPTAGGNPRYTLLCENSFNTGTPTLCRAREAQSRWKNSST